ncbi:MAG: hypothetical protein H0T61_00170 [Actinobacteria bacterium]|nr:hypothetical protein [Actinomycetota bacterium]
MDTASDDVRIVEIVAGALLATWIGAWLWVAKLTILSYIRWVWHGVTKVRPDRVAGAGRWVTYSFEVVATTGWKLCLAPYLVLLVFFVVPVALSVASIHVAAAVITTVP